MELKERTTEIIARLTARYPRPKCALDHESPLQLLLATILSAQCTDERVNQVTPVLFGRYPDAAALAGASQEEIEAVVRPTGFFRNKAKSIRECCRRLVDRHGGEVPRRMEDLLELPGVARKTANVGLGNAFGIAEGIVVDTHVRRLSNRLGLSAEEQPEKIEQDLMRLVPREAWIDFSHLLILHGRDTCQSRRPDCPGCVLLNVCPRIGLA